MVRFLALLLLLPTSAFAATLQADESLDVSVSPADNAYFAGAEVHVTAPLPDDLLAVAGMLEVLAPVGGDALVAGGTVTIGSTVVGDVRALGGNISIAQDVGGDIAALGGSVRVAGRAQEVQVAGASVEIANGALGPVTVYGTNVSLAGEFAGNVRVVASDRVTLAEGTTILGTFEYNAPQEAVIPASARIDGGVSYIGSSSFLPTTEQANTFALAGLGVLFVVRLVAGALAAGLLVGLFPAFTNRLVSEVFSTGPSGFMRAFLIGFAAFVLTPILVVLLLASFVGIGIAAVLGAAYILVLLLSYLYAAALAGALLMRLSRKTFSASWKSTILGMVVLYLLGLVPGLGFVVALVLSAAALGSLLILAQQFAFKREAL